MQFSFILMLLVFAFDGSESQNCGYPLKTITVSQSGNADFKTIKSALDSVPKKNPHYWIHIQILPGVYREHIDIPVNRPCIYLEGAGRDSTSIEWSDHSVATFFTRASNIVAKGITFMNTLNNPVTLNENESSNITQALAARIHGDKCAFFDCAFLGVQDTLCDDYGRHYYHNCYIQGGVDFIYGNGQSIFEASTIYFSMGNSGSKIDGFITAQERESPDKNTGFVIKNCIINGTGGKAELGRALTAYSRVIIANSFLTDVVKPEGWSQTKYVGHEANITYVEEGCRGPGANKSKRVKWMKSLSGPELQKFLDISYIDSEGWIDKLPTKRSFE